MGNICRSPLAEGIFLHHAAARGRLADFEVDSAGTGGWHAGDKPDHRSEAVAHRNGVVLVSRARQVCDEDFEQFDLLVCMDADNERALRRMGCPVDRIVQLMDYDSDAESNEVPDPYYGGPDGFELMFALIDSAIGCMLDDLHADDDQ